MYFKSKGDLFVDVLNCAAYAVCEDGQGVSTGRHAGVQSGC